MGTGESEGGGTTRADRFLKRNYYVSFSAFLKTLLDLHRMGLSSSKLPVAAHSIQDPLTFCIIDDEHYRWFHSTVKAWMHSFKLLIQLPTS